jgi:FdhD protein
METHVPMERINLRTREREKLEEPVAIESPVNIYVNGEHIVTLLASPELKRELVLGWLLDEGILKSLDEIDEVHVKENDVKVKTKKDIRARLKAATMMRLVTTACGSISDFIKLIDRVSKPFVKSTYSVKAEDVLSMVAKLNEMSKVFRSCGGTHSAALFCDGRLVAQAEDVGRHNAVDKVIGVGALKGVNFGECVLVTSGRQTVDMPMKAARVGIPIIASITAPTHSAIMAAEKTGVTLICFVRGHRMNVYSYPHRVSINGG